jgi:ketosteroid isomerase-like protein
MSMSDPKIETVKKIYEAFGRGDVDAILAEVHDDVDWAIESSVAGAPWHGPRRNKSEVRRFFEEIAGSISVTEFAPFSFAANDTDVFAVIRFALTAKATGKSGATQLHHWWRFQGGKISHYRGTEDTALTAQILGK